MRRIQLISMPDLLRVCSWLFALLALAATPLRAASVWVEGEDAAEKHVNKHMWYDAVHKDGMSGGDWISHWGAKPGTAAYKFDVPEAGPYTFWWRGNPFAAKVSYRLNGAAEEEIGFAEKRGEYQISDKPDLRFLAWVKVGKVTLAKGPNVIVFTFHSDNNNHGGMDCFLFDNGGFVPSGVQKPGAGEAAGIAGTAGTAGAGQEQPAAPAPPDQVIWIEGEDAAEKHVKKHGWYDAVKKDGMSGGEWVSHYGDQPGTVTYKFAVAKGDEYTFWWRGNVSMAKVSYALNGGVPVEMSFADKRGEYMISEKPDHRFLAWVKVGKVNLPQGQNTLTFTFHSDVANHGGIDCFCFTRIAFTPSGTNKPTVASAGTAKAGPGDWFPVVFDTDAFSEKSVIDMSKYIDAPAGKLGFLRRDGESLRFQQGTAPVKLWGCGANLQGTTFTREQLTQRARYLRKYGVNVVRQHAVQDEIGLLHNGQFDAKRLDAFDWWFAELKKNGIYMDWSVFYPMLITGDDGYEPELFNELEVKDKEHGTRGTSGLVNVEPKLQEIQFRYLRSLLTHKNPYTGLRYVDDPELAVLEFQNEDCVFFYFPLNGLREGKTWPMHSKRLRQKFFAWATRKYGTEAALKQAWGKLSGGDSFANGELALMGAHNLGQDGPLYEFAGQSRRAGDFIHFLTDLQRGFYERREKELKEIGFKAVTVTTAWRAGGPAADPANLYCDTAADMIDRHNYFGGGAGGHGISPGDVHNESHLARPGAGLLGVGLYQVENRPFSYTEWTQMPPNQWKAEAAPLIAFYGMGLQGWDASYHFTSSRPYPGDGWPNLSSYVTDTPHYIGQFPALFFALSHGHVKEAPAAAARRLKADDLYSGVDPLRQDFTGGGHDAKTLKGQLVTPVEALAIGKVTVGFETPDSPPGVSGPGAAVDFSKFWDKEKKVIRSMTGELTWDYGKQIVTLQAPRTEAILGRAGGETFSLPGANVKVTTPFVSLIFTPLDDLPLAGSKHVLITAMARDTQTNAKYSEDGKKLLTLGGPPLLMEPVQATIKLAGAVPVAVNVLDVYGVPTGQAVKPETDGSFTLGGEYRTYYYEVKR